MTETSAEPATIDAASSTPQATTTPPSTAKSGSDAVLGLLVWVFIGGFWFFSAVQSWLYRGLAAGAVAAVFLIWIVRLWGNEQGKATWESFKRQTRLLAALAFTILGAPAIAILLAHNDRVLA